MSTKKIVLAIIFNSIIVSQTISNQGMIIMSSLINNDIPDHWSPYELSIRYIPALSLKKNCPMINWSMLNGRII